MKTYLLHEFTRLDLERLLDVEPNTVAIFCLGSIEQHGPHLPLGTDIISVQDRALRIAKETNSIVCLTTLAGYSPQHMNFKGTISFSQETLSNIIIDTIMSLYKHSFNRVLILNSHATNTSIIECAILKIKEVIDISIAFTSTLPSNFHEMLKQRKYCTLDIHAGLSETSVMKAIRPDLIDEAALQNHHSDNKFKFLDNINSKENFDEIDKFLFETLLPSKSELISESGVYGTSALKKADSALYTENIDKTIQFYVNFIKRWKKEDV